MVQEDPTIRALRTTIECVVDQDANITGALEAARAVPATVLVEAACEPGIG